MTGISVEASLDGKDWRGMTLVGGADFLCAVSFDIPSNIIRVRVRDE